MCFFLLKTKLFIIIETIDLEKLILKEASIHFYLCLDIRVLIGYLNKKAHFLNTF